MAVAAVPVTLAMAGGSSAVAVTMTAAAMGAAAAATTAAMGAAVVGLAAGAMGGMMMMGSGGEDQQAPAPAVERADPTAAEDLLGERDRNANLRRTLYSSSSGERSTIRTGPQGAILQPEDTVGLSLLGA